jgi:hypothetical protein
MTKDNIETQKISKDIKPEFENFKVGGVDATRHQL